MTPAELGIVSLLSALVQSLIIVALLWLLMRRAGFGAEYFLVALLPASGVFVAGFVPLMIAAFRPGEESFSLLVVTLPGYVATLFLAVPLYVLWRGNKGRRA